MKGMFLSLGSLRQKGASSGERFDGAETFANDVDEIRTDLLYFGTRMKIPLFLKNKA